jgi:aminoglycoside phosphotransferase (APT) family kinase protein
VTASLALDLGAASRLAELDPALAQLAAALPHDPDAADWLLHDARWTPGQGCRLAYRVPSAGASPTFVDVSVTPGGWTAHDYREDDHLPGLAVAADPAVVATRLEPAIGEPVQSCRVEPVRYRPGLRCVLRYEVQTAARRSTFFAKVFRRSEFDAVAPVVVALSGRADGNDLVPALTGVWPDADTLVVRAVAGRSVSSVLRDPSVPAPERARVARSLGELLARFHAQTGVQAPSWSPADQLAALAQSLPAAECADAALARRLHDVGDLLAAAQPSEGTEVLGHGAFRAGQVVLGNDGRLVVLDVDGVCHTAPGRDLGSALAHLLWQGLCQPDQRDAVDEAGQALLASYEEQAGAVDRRSLDWWRAAALLQVAARRFRRLETGDWGRAPGLVDAAVELLSADRPPASPGRARDLLDRQHMTDVLARVLSPAAGAGPLHVESAQELASASGRRAVVRYRIRGLDGPDPTVVVGKAFVEPRRAELLHEHLRLLSSAATALTSARPGTPPLPVPEPLAHVPEMGLVVYRHHDGLPLSRMTDAGALLDGVRGAARWLAALHSCSVSLPRHLSLEGETRSTREWAALIGRVHPDLADQARHLAEGWARAVRSAPAAPEVPLHKDFHPGHVLLGAHDAGGTDLHVIDLDEARLGDAAFDLGHFRAYVQLLEGKDAPPGTLATAFLEEYAAATGWVDRGTLAAFEAYAWLKIARQWTAAAAPFRAGSPARRRTGVEHALVRGTACLNG